MPKLCAIGYYIAYMIDISIGALGRHQQYVTGSAAESLHLRLYFAISDSYTWAVTFIKMSLACMILRIQFNQKPWRIGIPILMAVMVMFALACTLMNWLQCRPIRAYWDYSISRDHCLAPNVFPNWVFGASCKLRLC
jgi:hypothetical protein